MRKEFATNDSKMKNYFNLPNPSLRAYFKRVEDGQPEVYRTTFYKGKSTDEILKGWMPTLEKVHDKFPTLLDFEKDLASKVGPMSVMKPLKERMDDIDSYYSSILKESKPISKEAIESVIKEFGGAKGLRLRSRDRTLNVMKKSTNSGSPYFQKRSAVVDKTMPCEVRFDPRIPKQILAGTTWDAGAVLGWRGQEGGPKTSDVKQRVVWMFPFAVNIEELRLYQPLIEVFQKFNYVPAWVSMDSVDERITRLFDTKQASDLIVCTDFSKFDQHFNQTMADCARTILEALMTDDGHSRYWLDNVFPIKYVIPLVYNWNQIRYGRHGMGSGSGGTNADETLTHRALQYEAAQSVGAILNPNSMCLGDDGILSYPGITVEDVTSVYSSHGQDMNLDKQYASTDDCTYLRRWHHKEYRENGICVGVYSTCRALGRLAMQERYYDPENWGPKMVALRQLSIIENCKYHPLREEFVDYCMKGDKYRLGIDIPGFLDNIDKFAAEATENMPDFLGYTKSMQKDADTGISQWWIVQYLRTMKSKA